MHPLLPPALPFIVLMLALLCRQGALRGAALGCATAILVIALHNDYALHWAHIAQIDAPSVAIVTLSAALVIIPGQIFNAALRDSGAVGQIGARIAGMQLTRTKIAAIIALGIAPTIESMTGFGVSLFFSVPVFLRLFAPRRALLLALLSMNIMPWGTLGFATILGAQIAAQPMQPMAQLTAAISAAVFPLIGVLVFIVCRMRDDGDNADNDNNRNPIKTFREFLYPLSLGILLSATLIFYNTITTAEIAGVCAGITVTAIALLIESNAFTNTFATTFIAIFTRPLRLLSQIRRNETVPKEHPSFRRARRKTTRKVGRRIVFEVADTPKSKRTIRAHLIAVIRTTANKAAHTFTRTSARTFMRAFTRAPASIRATANKAAHTFARTSARTFMRTFTRATASTVANKVARTFTRATAFTRTAANKTVHTFMRAIANKTARTFTRTLAFTRATTNKVAHTFTRTSARTFVRAFTRAPAFIRANTSTVANKIARAFTRTPAFTRTAANKAAHTAAQPPANTPAQTQRPTNPPRIFTRASARTFVRAFTRATAGTVANTVARTFTRTPAFTHTATNKAAHTTARPLADTLAQTQRRANPMRLAPFIPYLALLAAVAATRLPPIYQTLQNLITIERAGLQWFVLTSPGICILLALLIAAAHKKHRLQPRAISEGIRRALYPLGGIFLFGIFAQLHKTSGIFADFTARLIQLDSAQTAQIIFIAPLLAMLSGWLTGSNVGGNVLLMTLQTETGAHFGNPQLFAALQNSGAGHSVFISLPIILLTLSIASAHNPKLDTPQQRRHQQTYLVRRTLYCAPLIYLAITAAFYFQMR